jgi:altronate hydrolase
MHGYLRSDGRKGIRNHLLVVYLVECAHHVARLIATPFAEEGVEVIGFPGCFDNEYAQLMLERLCTHPNVGAVMLASLGCEMFRGAELQEAIAATGRPVKRLVIQRAGGTRSTVDLGRAWVRETLDTLHETPTVPVYLSDLVIGTECGGSDGTSVLTANPAVGRAADRMVDAGGTVLFEELGELFGCEDHMAARAATPELGQEISRVMSKAIDYYDAMEHSSFGGGNVTGGLSTIEEKSVGAYAKSGTRPIMGLLTPGVVPPSPGLYLMDMVSDGSVKHGMPNINDTATIVELIACGCHIVLFTTGRGSVTGSAVSPVLKICANPDTYDRLSDDMDVNAGKILRGEGDLDSVATEIIAAIERTASGIPSRSEELGHQEFHLGYKQFDVLGPSCLPQVS